MEMTFNLQKFSADVKAARGNKTQKQFARDLGLKNHSLISMYEECKRAPSKDAFAAFCNLTGRNSSDYWEQKEEDVPAAYFMGSIDEKDKSSLDDVLNKITSYEYLFAQFKRIK